MRGDCTTNGASWAPDRAARIKNAGASHLSLGERSADVLGEYRQLVDDTLLAAQTVGQPYIGMSPDPSSAGFFIDEWDRALLRQPALAGCEFLALVGRWWRYSRHHRELVQRSPLMELEHYLVLISESHGRVSWHDSVELLVPWLDGGAKGPPPLVDDDGVMTKRVVDRLAAIRSATRGWLYAYTWGTYFLDDRQVTLVPSGESAQFYLEQTRETRPSFEGC